MRCYTLAQSFKKLGWQCEFICNSSAKYCDFIEKDSSFLFHYLNDKEDEKEQIKNICNKNIDLFILDDYKIDVSYETYCRKFSNHILIIDDLPSRIHDADYLLDQTFERKDNEYCDFVPPHCKLFLGTDYALLREEFSLYRANYNANDKVSNILVSISSSDPFDFTSVALQAILFSKLDVSVDVILASNASNLADVKKKIKALPYKTNLHIDINAKKTAQLIVNSDIGIGSAGISIWERCCLGLPTVVVMTADNQKHIVSNLDKKGVIEYLGHAKDVDYLQLANCISMLNKDVQRRVKLSQNAFNICDGKGSMRVAEKINKEFL